MRTELNRREILAPSAASVRLPLTLNSFDCFMAFALSILIAAETILAKKSALTLVEHGTALIPWLQIGLVLAAFIYCRIKSAPKLLQAAWLLLWSSLCLGPLAFVVLIAARSPFGLVDKQLMAADAFLHINTAAVHALVMSNSLLNLCSGLSYTAFIPLIPAAVAIPCLFGYSSASRRFIVGVMIGIIIGAAIFVFLPAIGPWTCEAMQPSKVQALMGASLLHLKSGSPIRISLGNSAIVSFPSEHVVVAILGARALSAIRPIRIPMWTLSVLICVSTLTTGWHYGVDVIGGVLVAMISMLLADSICTWLESLELPVFAASHVPLAETGCQS